MFHAGTRDSWGRFVFEFKDVNHHNRRASFAWDYLAPPLATNSVMAHGVVEHWPARPGRALSTCPTARVSPSGAGRPMTF
jgi:hypothetical protein